MAQRIFILSLFLVYDHGMDNFLGTSMVLSLDTRAGIVSSLLDWSDGFKISGISKDWIPNIMARGCFFTAAIIYPR
jgi:hypothetical protein